MRLSYTIEYLTEARTILGSIDEHDMELLIHGIASITGRVFVLGVGGSAANASHVVNDLRKMCDIEAYAPTDNVAELTARTNDDGWQYTFSDWLRVSGLGVDDALLVLSVGGGSATTSPNIVEALDYAKQVRASIFGIVGRDGGVTGTLADACVIIPPLYADTITPHTEGICSVLLHLLVSHPTLAA